MNVPKEKPVAVVAAAGVVFREKPPPLEAPRANPDVAAGAAAPKENPDVAAADIVV